jgi:hypothetical protein
MNKKHITVSASIQSKYNYATSTILNINLPNRHPYTMTRSPSHFRRKWYDSQFKEFETDLHLIQLGRFYYMK